MAVAAGARRGRGEVSLAALTTEGAAARRVGCAQAATASSSGLQVRLCSVYCLTLSELWLGKGSRPDPC